MRNYESARALILQILKTRMAFRQTLQCVLKRNNMDMTFEMLQIMNCLWHEQGVSQQMLAEKTAKDKACLTNLMTNLEKRAWVIRKEDPSDGRNRLVYLTPEGEKMNDCVRPLIKELYSQVGMQMGVEEIDVCIDQLKKLDEILNQL
ncbi:MAG: MarR family transcriptional regulator [Bacteroides sp.]